MLDFHSHVRPRSRSSLPRITRPFGAPELTHAGGLSSVILQNIARSLQPATCLSKCVKPRTVIFLTFCPLKGSNDPEQLEARG